MADSFTPNLNLRKPEVGAAFDTWGGTAGINSDMDLLDAVFLATGLGTPVGLHVGATQVLNIEGTVLFADSTDTTKAMTLDSSLITTGTLRTLQAPDEDGIIATQGELQNATQGLVPTGTVMSGYYGAVAPPGFVLLRGRTIGDASSAATELADPSTQTLFTLLWNLGFPVSGGFGASPAADYAAHKTATLPDHRGRVMAAIDTTGGVLPGGNVRGGSLGAFQSSTMDGPNDAGAYNSPNIGAAFSFASINHIHHNVYVVQPTITVDAIIKL